MKLKSASSNTRVVSSNSRVTSSTLRVTISNLRVKLRVQTHELRVQIHELRVQIRSYELKSISYKFKSTRYEFKTSSSRIILSMKTQVNSLNISPFSKILSLKSFRKSWGNSYVQILVIIPCFTFPLFHDYSFTWKQSE